MSLLTTDRLNLTPLSDAHRALYCRLYTDPEVMRYVGACLDRAKAEHCFALALGASASPSPGNLIWSMDVRGDRVSAGLVGLRIQGEEAEVGALILPEFQASGLATEAIAAMADHAFAILGLRRLLTRHRPEHTAAAALMRRLGFSALPDEAANPMGQRWELEAGWKPTERKVGDS
jgi:RimJ/RimL family protein N-acetyltransferase